MRLIHSHHFTNDERETFRGVIFDNIMVAMQIILEAMDALKIDLDQKENQQYVLLFDDIPSIERGGAYPENYLMPVKSLWADRGVQTAFRQGNSFALDDNANL
jgi:guanine nucleotide-binding protein subunit alpha